MGIRRCDVPPDVWATLVSLTDTHTPTVGESVPVRMSEAEFTTAVIDFARSLGYRVAHFRPARVTGKDGKETWRTAVQGDGKGFPDVLFLRGSSLFVAELKVGKNKTTREQDEWLSAFRAAGVRAFVWRPCDWEEIRRELGAT